MPPFDVDSAASKPTPASEPSTSKRQRKAHASVKPPKRLHRRWWQKLLILFNVLVIGLCGLLSYGLYYAKNTVNKLQKIVLLPGTLAATSEGQIAAGAPINILLTGTDSSAKLAGNDPVQVGRNGEQNTDTIMIMRIEPQYRRAAILSIPRDTVVQYTRKSGNVGRSKINEVAYNGIDVLIKAISDDYGIPINHYVGVDFAGFQGLVDAVNGVPIFFPVAARDTNTGFFANAGCQVLTGEQALGYARSRHYQVFAVNGHWYEDGTDDYGRIRRQQDFIRRAIKKAIAAGARNPSTMLRLIDKMLPSATFDDQFNTVDKVFNFAKTLKDLDPDKIKTYTVQVTGYEGWSDGLKVLDNSANKALFDYFANGSLGEGFTPTTGPSTTSATPGSATSTTSASSTTPVAITKPSQVAVQVFNASGVPGVGATVTNELQAAKFTISAAAAKGDYQAKTEIRYGTGGRERAEFLARYISGDAPKIVADPTVSKGEVALYLGENYTSLLSTAKAAATTTTTAPGQVTTTTAPALPEAPSAPRTFGPDPANPENFTPEQTSAAASCA